MLGLVFGLGLDYGLGFSSDIRLRQDRQLRVSHLATTIPDVVLATIHSDNFAGEDARRFHSSDIIQTLKCLAPAIF